MIPSFLAGRVIKRLSLKGMMRLMEPLARSLKMMAALQLTRQLTSLFVTHRQ